MINEYNTVEFVQTKDKRTVLVKTKTDAKGVNRVEGFIYADEIDWRPLSTEWHVADRDVPDWKPGD